MIGRGIILVALATIAAADPGPVVAPEFKTGDRWIFDQTVERGVQGFDKQRLDMMIERTGVDTMLVGIKRDGSPGAYEDHMIGTDWSLRRLMDGQDAPTARPFNFPMKVGQTWSIDYIDPNPRGTQTATHVKRTYKVTGWEDVTVPAGTFHAIKIEVSGVDQATIAVPNAVVGGAIASSSGGETMTRSQRGGTRLLIVRRNEQFFYAPLVKNYVKSIEEQYNVDETLLLRQTRMLVSFTAGA